VRNLPVNSKIYFAFTLT